MQQEFRSYKGWKERDELRNLVTNLTLWGLNLNERRKRHPAAPVAICLFPFFSSCRMPGITDLVSTCFLDFGQFLRELRREWSDMGIGRTGSKRRVERWFLIRVSSILIARYLHFCVRFLCPPRVFVGYFSLFKLKVTFFHWTSHPICKRFPESDSPHFSSNVGTFFSVNFTTFPTFWNF